MLVKVGHRLSTLMLLHHALAFTSTGNSPTTMSFLVPAFDREKNVDRTCRSKLPIAMESSSPVDFGGNIEDENQNLAKSEQMNDSGFSAKGRKPRRNNEAMGDTAFLRKRTNDLLRVTSDEFLSSSGGIEATLGRSMKVGRKTFNFLIDAWAFSGELDAADHAINLLDRMEFLQTIPHFASSSPDVRSYTKVINAISRSARPDAGEVAESILNKMEYLHLCGTNLAAKPNTFTYTAVIEAYANCGGDGAAEKAEDILERMIAKYQEGDPDVIPTSRCFNAAINAYGKSDMTDAAQRAEHIFHRMDAIYMSGVEEAKPNTFNYNSLITALANSGEEGSAQRAAEVLAQMEQCYAAGDMDCRPTTVSFNAVIDAYAKSGEEYGASRAEEIVRHMEDLYEAGEEVRPNTRSFNSVLNAYAKSGEEGGAQKAQELLDFMSSLYDRGNDAVQPDVHSFCTVINGKSTTLTFPISVYTCLTLHTAAWARSQQPNKAERANNLFRVMAQAYQNGNESLRPNVVAVNAVMNACAYTSGDVMAQNRAMEIAHKRLREIENSEYGSPDQVTYGTFLKVCANQMPDCSTRQQIIEVIFRKCAQNGQVGNIVIQQMKAMGPPAVYSRLIGRDINAEIRMEDLPSDWWCNVVEGKWRRRRQF